MDLVLFAGPVILRDAFKRIDWYGRDVRIVPIAHEDSSYFSSLAEQLRDRDGRILPTLVQRYAGVTLDQVDQIALTAYSAGHGLLNKVGQVPADVARLSALLLHDADFSGFSDPPKPGYVALGRAAMDGDLLMVVTASNTGGASYLTGRKSWLMVWRELQRITGRTPVSVPPQSPAPAAAGGWWRLGGALLWGDYVAPGSRDGQGNQYSHVGHHDLAPTIWQAYLAPWFARPRWLTPLLVGGAVATLGLLAWRAWRARRA